MVDPNLGLHAASELVSFLLKTGLESLVCVAVVRLTTSPRWRFNLWAALLLLIAGQWIWTNLSFIRTARLYPPPMSHAAAAVTAGSVRTIGLTRPIAGSITTILVALAVLYGVVLLCRLGGIAVGRFRLRRLMRHAHMPSPRLAQAFERALLEAQAAGARLNGCKLRILPGISSPATVGSLQPTVILPPRCESQGPQELTAILWHELKHVQRHDTLWNSLAQHITALLWFHPAVQYAAAQLRIQRELACDADVVRDHPHARDLYASCLLQFARSALRHCPAAAIRMASTPALLTRRIRTILSDPPPTPRWSLAVRAMAAIGLVSATATALPRANVLFAENAAFVLHTPARLLSLTPRPPEPSRIGHTNRTPHLRSAPAAAPISVAGVSVVPLPPHNEALAAEHRAALGVLTESTGMDPASGPDDRRSSDLSAPAPRSGAQPHSTSWGSIAVDAAERVGPLLVDRDGDEHHLHYRP